MMAPRLVVEGLRKSYRGVHAVDGLDFSVAPGSITGMIGPNGSGKSTAVDCITGFQPVDAGTIHLNGADITAQAPDRIARAGIMRSFQQVRVYDELPVIDNLCLAQQEFDGAGWLDAVLRSRRYRRVRAEAEARAGELLELVGLTRYTASPAGLLSYGQKKLVALAAALMPCPQLVILDEPVAGVNPTRVREVEAIIRRLNAAGESFLIIEHNVDFIMNLCQQVIVLDQGRKLAEGPPAIIREDPRVLAAYLGTVPEHSVARRAHV
jgi:branched-chain amino acid transport system ATP-binding protein